MDNVVALHKHPIVYILAENVEVGTDLYKKAMTWMLDMKVDVSRTRLYNAEGLKPAEAESLRMATKLGHIRLVAMGTEAARNLNSMDIEEYYSLPSPRETHAVVDADSLDLGKRFIYGELDED